MMNIPSSAAIGQALGSLRERRGLPLADVCRAASVSRRDLRAIEAGRERPSVEVLARIARSLGTTLVDLIRTAGTPPATAARLASLPDIARAIVELPAAVGSKVDAAEAAAVVHAMTLTDDNQSAAARLLGMERKAFVRRLANARGKR